jgi:hypothetical protein
MKEFDLLEFISILETFGITDRRFIYPFFQQLREADIFGGDGVQFAAAVIRGIKPRDQLEVMHAAQMAVMHWAAMKHMSHASQWAGTTHYDVAIITATKIMRTYSAQMEALKRYRTGGEQTITVQHVSVSEGGQAIVGNVTQNALEQSADNNLSLTDATQPAMPIVQQPECVPLSGRRQRKNANKPSA